MGMNQIIFLAAESTNRSFGETMEYALLNTLLGIGIVFIVLILISTIISLFKYISKAEAAIKGRKSVVETPQAVTEVSTEQDEVNLVDDLELVAVITAAIEAYEEANGNPVPENGLFVRSIRKVNKSRWQNA